MKKLYNILFLFIITVIWITSISSTYTADYSAYDVAPQVKNVPNKNKLDLFLNKVLEARKWFSTEKNYIIFVSKTENKLASLNQTYSGNQEISSMLDYLEEWVKNIKNISRQNNELDDFFCELLWECASWTTSNSSDSYDNSSDWLSTNSNDSWSIFGWNNSKLQSSNISSSLVVSCKFEWDKDTLSISWKKWCEYARDKNKFWDRFQVSSSQKLLDVKVNNWDLDCKFESYARTRDSENICNNTDFLEYIDYLKKWSNNTNTNTTDKKMCYFKIGESKELWGSSATYKTTKSECLSYCNSKNSQNKVYWDANAEYFTRSCNYDKQEIKEYNEMYSDYQVRDNLKFSVNEGNYNLTEWEKVYTSLKLTHWDHLFDYCAITQYTDKGWSLTFYSKWLTKDTPTIINETRPSIVKSYTKSYAVWCMKKKEDGNGNLVYKKEINVKVGSNNTSWTSLNNTTEINTCKWYWEENKTWVFLNVKSNTPALVDNNINLDTTNQCLDLCISAWWNNNDKKYCEFNGLVIKKPKTTPNRVDASSDLDCSIAKNQIWNLYYNAWRCPDKWGYDYWKWELNNYSISEVSDFFNWSLAKDCLQKTWTTNKVSCFNKMFCPSWYSYIRNTDYCEK